MRKWTKAAGLLFLAASSVYFDGANGIKPASAAPASPVGAPGVPGTSVGPRRGTSVKALPDVEPVPTTKPASTQPAEAAGPATQPAQPAQPAQPVQVAKAQVGQPVAPGQVAVKDIGTVEIHVNDANLVEVLRMLSLQSQKNIVASKDVRGSVTANLYDVTVKEALDAILRSNGYDYREKGNFIYVYTAKEIAEQEKAALVRKTEIFRLYYTPVANAANMIKPVLSEGAQVSFTAPSQTGIDSGGKDAGGNSHATEDILVVSDYPERLEQVRAVLKEVDRRPLQVLVEATILRASLQENNDLGVNFTALGGVNFSALSALGGGAGAAAGGATGTGTSSSTGSGLNEALTGTITDDPNASKINNKGFFAGQAGGNGLKMGIVTNNVSAFISAIEGVTDTVIVANPKVLVLNKQKGEVHVGSSLGYQTAVTTDTLTANNVQFLDVGTRLIFRPYVGDNGNIRMEIHPEDSSGTVNQGLPNKFSTEITTNVLVKDGHTIVIGGLFRDSTGRTRSQVPGLGSLPGIGAAFRHQTDTSQRDEVIILLTPHIIKDEAAYSEASEQQLQEAERLRVGMRKGLMPWGRERMAEGYYEKAVEEMNKPNPDRKKALWYLNCATNMHPLFREAIDLKVKVTGHEATAADNSTIHGFVRQAILSDKASGATLPSDAPTVVPPLQPTGGSFLFNPAAPVTPAGVKSPTTAPTSPTSQPTLVKSDAKVETSPAAPTTAPTTAPATADASAGPATRPSRFHRPMKDLAATDQGSATEK